MPSPLVTAAIGASAGGVEALRALFGAIRPGTTVSYIVQLHLARDRDSALTEILARDCLLPVATATQGAALLPGHVLVIPPGVIATVVDAQIRLTPDTVAKGKVRQVDALLASLALDQREYAVGVVLSGFGSDGTLGVKAIKEHGGLTIAQGSSGGDDGPKPAHHGMPDSAIAGGLVDLVLAAEAIPEALDTYAGSFATLAVIADPGAAAAEDQARIGRARLAICETLRRDVGHDFSGYKEPSFLRRVQRRMQVLRLDSIEAYQAHLNTHHAESQALLRDLLIGVTSFFRDAEAFTELAELVIPKLFEGKGAADTVRVWVPGCATGEEAYSIAMLLSEHAATLRGPPRLQVFATDIDAAALQVARLGQYPEAQLDAVSPARLERCFVRTGTGRAVAPAIQETCIFSAHSVIRDPPFSRLDLISCRNLLIYLDLAAQRELFPVFHFALRPSGYLLLGTAESASQSAELFRPLDKRQRIYQRRDHAAPVPKLPQALPPVLRQGIRPLHAATADTARPVRAAAAEAVLERFAPAHVVVNRDGEVVHFSTRTGPFLEAAPGLPTRSLFALARRGLRLDLRTALQDLLRTGRPATRRGLDADRIGVRGAVSITLESLEGAEASEPLYLVVFDTEGPPVEPDPALPEAEAAVAAERELRSAHERLQGLIEEYDTAAEELRASNEEMVSVNEELQSANEELETSKEEQQSVNEELQAVNLELQEKVAELDRSNADLRNLFEATRVATVVLDRSLAIRSFTPAVARLFNLLPSDRGRPITDIAGSIDTAPLLADARAVLDGQQPVDRRIGSRDGKVQFLMRVLPYVPTTGAVDGVIAAFVDVTELVEAIETRDDQQLLVKELNHRVRNMLQAVIGITHQTLREKPDPAEFGKALIERIGALSKAYQLITQENWSEIGLRELVMEQLGPHLARPELGSAAGPPVQLRPAAAVNLALVLHELATNAIKHGALGAEAGTVAVTWTLQGEGSAATLALRWEERGGPPVKPPTRQGFGTELLKIQVERALRGRIEVAYRPEGLLVTLTLPVGSEIHPEAVAA